jgi:hypothetical protein
MKRLQFSLRLMLLIVALFATIFGWWTITTRLEHNRRLEQLRKGLEAAREIHPSFHEPEGDVAVWSDIAKRDAAVMAVERKLKEEMNR